MESCLKVNMIFTHRGDRSSSHFEIIPVYSNKFAKPCCAGFSKYSVFLGKLSNVCECGCKQEAVT